MSLLDIGAYVKCHYEKKCQSFHTDKCKGCSHNILRNYVEDFFTPAKDKEFPKDGCPRLSYDGPAEQTAGYKCPVCGAFTNPYAVTNNQFGKTLCQSCGYLLNIGR